MVHVALVDEVDIAHLAAVERERLHFVLLNGLSLVGYAFAFASDFGFEKALPFAIGEGEVVEPLQLPAQIGYQFILVVYEQALIALPLQLADKVALEVGLGLV